MSDLVGDILNASELAYWIGGTLTLIAGLLVWIMSEQIWMASLFAPVSFFGALTGVYVGRETAIRLHNVQEGDVVLWSCVGMIVASGIMLVIMRLLYALGQPKTGFTKADPVSR
jgi:hypothetical protein